MKNFWLDQVRQGDRFKRYEKYKEISRQPKIQSELRDYVLRICQPKDGRAIVLRSHNLDTKSVAEEFLVRANIQHLLSCWVKNTLIYGDVFLRLIKGHNGVEKIEKITNKVIKKNNGLGNGSKSEYHALDHNVIYDESEIIHILGFYKKKYFPYGGSMFSLPTRDWFSGKVIMAIKNCFCEQITHMCFRNSYQLYVLQGKKHGPFVMYKHRLTVGFAL
jgi:hypothetical protein